MLWTNQGLIFGEYPGNEKKNIPAGHYVFEDGKEGKVIPEAPAWLLAMMRAAKGKEGFIKNRQAMRLTDRSPALRQQMIFECLDVIPEQGPGSYEMWWRIGMAIHSELPDEVGFDLWKWWSKKDPHFDDDWDDERGEPQKKWNKFKPDGKITFGTLSYIADLYDPERTRFSEESRDAYEQERARVVQEIRNTVLSHADVVNQAKEILDLDNPSEINHRMNALAIAAGYRDRSSIEALMLSQLEYERRKELVTWQELQKQQFKSDYLIPDILPSQAVVVLYGAGGEGKSTTAWTIAKHVAMGIPFVVRGKHVPVKPGPVLVLNGDQPDKQVQQQLEEVEMPLGAPIFIQNNWQLKRYNEFCKLMDKIKPSLVIIDSLIGCSSGDSFDENKSEFAAPLYWLTKNNGQLYPGTATVIVHHANKSGGFRGTSAIRDAVDETWSLKVPEGGLDTTVPANARIITIEKSRSGRGGTALIMQMEADLTYSVRDFTPEIDQKKTTPDGIIDRVLMKIRTVFPRAITKAELVEDPICGGRVAAITKALQRLEVRGLITSTKEGKVKFYTAVLSKEGGSRGEGGGSCPPSKNPSPGTGPVVDNDGGQEEVSTMERDSGQPSDVDNTCPPPNASPEEGSGDNGQPGTYPPEAYKSKWDD